MPNQEEQALTLDHALWFGRMCREHSQSMGGQISQPSLKKQSVSQNQKPLTLQYLATDGLLPDATWEDAGLLLGEYLTLNTGESHNVAVESRLSQILEANPHPKYCLSPRACQGILNCAERRGKELPEMLRTALEMQSASSNELDALGGGKGLLIQNDQTGTLSTVQNQSVCYGICSFESNCMKSDNPNSGIYEADTSRTLDNNGGNPACNQGGIAVVYALQGSMIGRDDANGPQGDGVNQDTCFTVNTTDRHAVVYENHAQDCRYDDVGDVAPTCTSRYGTGGGNMPIVVSQGINGDIATTLDAHYNNCPGMRGGIERDVVAAASVDCRNAEEDAEINGTLQAKSNGGTSLNLNNVCGTGYIVRRLTPTECERLQGFPDGWTDIGEWTDSKGKKRITSDSARYKALGNSIAIPPWLWVCDQIGQYLGEDKTMASLFDGIGGFPLIWSYLFGADNCVWASEIEEFPIAVTKRRFPERESEKSVTENAEGVKMLIEGSFKAVDAFQWVR